MTTLLFDELSIECDSSKATNDGHKNVPGDFHFPLQLRYELGDVDKYEVACCDIIYPISWYNLEEDAKIIWKLEKKDDIRAIVHASCYPDVSDLVDAINLALSESTPTDLITYRGMVKFYYESATNTVKLQSTLPSKITFSFTSFPSSLSSLIGYAPGSDTKQCDISNGIHSFYICLDLIEPQIVGNGKERVLQIVHIPNRLVFGKVEQLTFFPRKYMRLALNEFDKIKITIKDTKNRIVNFRSGCVKIYLNFRRCF